MKALMLRGLNHLELVDASVPKPLADQVLIRTRYATICTSDLVDIAQNPSDIALPIIIGHEGMGTVEAVGSDVTEFEVGQTVATHPVHPCHECSTCKAGRGHLCPNMQHFGLNMPGTFAEYYVARVDRVRAVPDTADIAPFCLAEPLAVCLQAINQANLKQGNHLLIVGDGPFGLIMSRLAANYDLGRIVLAGWSDFRLGFARSAEPINTYNSPDAATKLIESNDGHGYDAAILAVASPQALDDALRCLRPKGRLVVFASLQGDVRIDLHSVHMKELEIVGACNDEDLFDLAIKNLIDHDWSDIITHRFPIEAFEVAFDLARNCHDRALKVALEF